MSTKMTCAKCGSNKVMTDLHINDKGHYGADTSEGLTVEVQGDPKAIFFKEIVRASLTANVCSSCGFTEIFTAGNLDRLWVHYKRANR